MTIKSRHDFDEGRNIVAYELLATKSLRYQGSVVSAKFITSVAVIALDNGEIILKAPYEESLPLV